MAGRAVQYYDVAGYLVGRPAGAFTLFITIVSLVSTSEHPLAHWCTLHSHCLHHMLGCLAVCA